MRLELAAAMFAPAPVVDICNAMRRQTVHCAGRKAGAQMLATA